MILSVRAPISGLQMLMPCLLSCRHASTCKPFEPVSGPHVWYRSDYQDVESYSYTLTPGDIEELASAVAEVQRRGIELKVRVVLVHYHVPLLHTTTFVLLMFAELTASTWFMRTCSDTI